MLNAAISLRSFSSLFSRLSIFPVLAAGLLAVPASAQQSTSSYNFAALAIGSSTTQSQTLTIPFGARRACSPGCSKVEAFPSMIRTDPSNKDVRTLDSSL